MPIITNRPFISAGGKQGNFAFDGGIDECVLYGGVIAEAVVVKHFNAGIAAGA